ncbi:cystathionine beta-lyase [Stackebrandtia endophytica]|uniref:cysteine-S-conjugate beta-lyase n=1 Tax=Stackebrandtia endophytica TaxID=1496996 RepID=A0A543AQT2_9ACTN|nr:aminotransferase class I/II-fold pyridoxal phosphate-dependent enzyme [Stackebrandtia endophytica]TQL74947.1 cystathionine beta-lyase [Stackebrandtia endophytica]
MSDSARSPFEVVGLEQLRRRNSVKWRTYPEDVLPLWVAEMDTALAAPIAEVLRESVETGDTGYAFDGGFGEAFAGFAADRYGWNLTTAPILVADVMAGVHAALEAATERGDRVVISTPVYTPFYSAIEQIGRVVVASPLTDSDEGQRIDLDRLERDFVTASAYLMCNPHNPTGHVLTESELTAIAELATRHGVTVISDEIHAPLMMPGHRHIPFAALDSDAARASFTLAAASKAWNLAGLKAALLIPGPTAPVSGLSSELWAAAGLFGVIAGTTAFQEAVPWLDEVVAAVDHNRHLLADLVADRLPGVRYRPSEATYLAWLDFRDTGLGDDPAAAILEYGRVAVNSGLSFGVEAAGRVRMNIATSPAMITEAVDRIASVLERS